MANNRMYLVNTATGARIMLAKYYPSTGWFLWDNVDGRIDAELEEADFGHLTIEQRAANAAVLGFGVPFTARGGMYGADWRLEYETG